MSYLNMPSTFTKQGTKFNYAETNTCCTNNYKRYMRFSSCYCHFLGSLCPLILKSFDPVKLPLLAHQNKQRKLISFS